MLARWVAEGLISQEQAGRIAAAEAARAGQRPGPAAGHRTSLAVEALGYTGGVLAIAAGFLALRDLWPGIPAPAQLGFAGAAAVALGLGGAALRDRRDPALGRLCGVLWLMSVASLAGAAAILTAEILHLAGEPAAFTSAAAAACYAAALWLLRRNALQHLALFATTTALVGAGVSWAWPGLRAWGPGLGIWVLSALWWLAVSRGYLGPRPAGDVAAALGLLVGAQLTMELAAGHVLAVATVAGLLIAGVAVRRVWLVALGAVGVLLVVPQTAVRYLPASAGAPLAVFVVGLTLVAVAVWLARHRTPHSR